MQLGTLSLATSEHGMRSRRATAGLAGPAARGRRELVEAAPRSTRELPHDWDGETASPLGGDARAWGGATLVLRVDGHTEGEVET